PAITGTSCYWRQQQLATVPTPVHDNPPLHDSSPVRRICIRYIISSASVTPAHDIFHLRLYLGVRMCRAVPDDGAVGLSAALWAASVYVLGGSETVFRISSSLAS